MFVKMILAPPPPNLYIPYELITIVNIYIVNMYTRTKTFMYSVLCVYYYYYYYYYYYVLFLT